MGFFDDADVNLNDIPDDSFGFGNDFHPIRIIECGEPKVTANRDKVGMMLKWMVDDPAFADNKPTQAMRQWVQLPVPKELWNEIPWDPKANPEQKKVLVDLRDLFVALGFKNDEMGSVDGEKMLHRGALAKIKPRRNSEGFWEFSLFQMKPLPENGSGSSEGMNEFAGNGQQGSAQDLVARELDNV